MMDDYDYGAYEKYVTCLLNDMWRDPENLEIGYDISGVSEVKIIFDGYGYNEDTDEQDDKNMESYAIFIHRDSILNGEVFPEHETSPWCLIHRPSEEACLYAWYDVSADEWTISSLEESTNEMSNGEIMELLEVVYNKHYENFEHIDSYPASWPFPTITKDKNLVDSDILDKAKELGFTTKDLGDTYVGSQRQLAELVRFFIATKN